MMTCKPFPVTGRTLLRLDLDPPARLLCRSGTLWLTHDGDTLDHVLTADMQLSVWGVVLVEGEGSFELFADAGPARHDVQTEAERKPAEAGSVAA